MLTPQGRCLGVEASVIVAPDTSSMAAEGTSDDAELGDIWHMKGR